MTTCTFLGHVDGETHRAALARVADLEAKLKQVADTRCLIWSHEHSAWWGPCSQGYTTNLTLAGIYSREEAIEIVDRATLDWTKAPNEVVVRLVDVPVAAWGVVEPTEMGRKEL